MASKPKSPGIDGNKVEFVDTDRLLLDPENPRLTGTRLSLKEQNEIVRVLWAERSVNEIVDSILANGYWPHEALFAEKAGSKFVVIEGNRRLAAAKIILAPSLRKDLNIPALRKKASKKVLESLESLPVRVCSREDLWEYVGFKHLNGPQDWDSIAKAQYIAYVHNDLKEELSDIALTIGDRHATVTRMYRGLMVLEQAEKEGLFDRQDCWNTRFAYSHLWTGLGYPGFRAFLGITPKREFSKKPVPANKKANLRDICLWLYGSRRKDTEPLIRKQNPHLKQLEEILSSPDGVAALRRGRPLETSLNLSRGDARLFREALVIAEDSLQEAMGLLIAGYEGEADLLSKGEKIAKYAKRVLEEMRRVSDSS